MSKKCILSFMIFAVFAAVMTAGAFLFAQLPLSLGARLGIGIGVFAVSAVIGLIFSESGVVCAGSLLLTAASWGVAVSAMFAELGAPSAAEGAAICGAAGGAFLLFCLLTILPVVRDHGTGLMIFWALAVSAGAVGYACTAMSTAGWYALLLLLPFLIFFAGLAADSEDAADHISNNNLLVDAIIMFAFVLVMYLRSGAGFAPMPRFLKSLDPDMFEFSGDGDDDDDDDSRGESGGKSDGGVPVIDFYAGEDLDIDSYDDD